MTDSVPGIGHIKGAVHYISGDKKGGNRVMLAASRTTVVMESSAVGFLIGGSPARITGEIIAERVSQASKIRTADYFRKQRENLNLPKDKTAATGKNGREIFCEAKDMKTGKTSTGINESSRTAYHDPAPRPNQFLANNPVDKPALSRYHGSCAEAQALHKSIVDPSRADQSASNNQILFLFESIFCCRHVEFLERTNTWYEKVLLLLLLSSKITEQKINLNIFFNISHLF